MGQDSIDIDIQVNEPGSGIVSGIIPGAPNTGIEQAVFGINPLLALVLGILIIAVMYVLFMYAFKKISQHRQVKQERAVKIAAVIAIPIVTVATLFGLVHPAFAAGFNLSFSSDKLSVNVEQGQTAEVAGGLHTSFSNDDHTNYTISAQLQDTLPHNLQLNISNTPLSSSPSIIHSGSGSTSGSVALAFDIAVAITGHVPSGNYTTKVVLTAESTGPAPVATTCPVSSLLSISNANQADYPRYPIGTQVYIPGGPDPWRDGTDTLDGCFPGPDNTGVAEGTALSDYVASLPARNEDPGHLTENFYFPDEETCYIKAPNTVIENQDLNCSLRIRSENVQIINSRVNGVIYIDDSWCDAGGTGESSFSLIDSTVFNSNQYGGRTLGMCDFTVLRSKVYGGPSVAQCVNCTIRDSFLYLDETSADSVDGIHHNSVIRVGSNANLLHNTIQCLVPSYDNTGTTSDSTESSGCSANQTAYSHDGLAPHDSVIKRNFYMTTSGGYCAWGGSTSGEDNLADGVHDLHFIENIFQRKNLPVLNMTHGTTSYTGTNCGIFGPIANFYDRPGHLWQCNRWDNGEELLSPVVSPLYMTNVSC